MDPEQLTQNIEFANTGLNIRVDPKRIPAGAFQYVNNIISEQEGAITVRRGRKFVGSGLIGGILPHTYTKMVVSTGELPAYVGSAGMGYVPSTNYRYFGDTGHLYRTQDFITNVDIASDGYNHSIAVNTTPNVSTLSPLWSAATFNIGTTGVPSEFFATQFYMLKDNSINLAGSHSAQKWGILPAYGVPTGQTVTVVSIDGSNPINVYTNLVHKQISGDEIAIAGVTGDVAANGFFFVRATSNTVMALYLDSTVTNSPIQQSGSYLNGGFVANLEGAFPSGGADGAPSASTPYSYAYTYANSKTLNESNLSQEMIANSGVTNGSPVAVYNNYVLINGIYGTDDPQVDLIYLYRKGGTFVDGLYRRIQVFGNPGLGATTGSYADTASDLLIANQALLQFPGFQDPPVPSTAPQPFRAQISASCVPGRMNANFSTTAPIFNGSGNRAGSTAVPTGGTRGSIMHFIGGEDVVIENITSTNIATIYVQKAYPPGTSVEIDTVCNQPCTLVCQAYDSLFVAGDPSNPHILYKSVTGSPEYFPVEDTAQNVLQVVVGNPGNPIINLTEFRGNILCMNLQNFFEISVFNGVMLPPNITPAQRGLVTKDAWCKVDNEIWYLGYDGVWSWDGSNSTKRSEAIDPLFHNLTINAGTAAAVYPLDYTPKIVQFCKMCYHRHKVQLVYRDTQSNAFELEYDIIADRWLRHTKNGTGLHTYETVAFVETDTGNKILMRPESFGSIASIDDAEDEQNNTADDYYDSVGPTAVGGFGSGGSTISATAITGWLDGGNPFIEKVIDEFMLDVDLNSASGATAITVKMYQDYSFTAMDTWNLPSNTSGRQWISLIANSQSDANLSNLASGYSRALRTVAFEFDFTAGPLRPSLYGMRITFRPVGAITAGPVYDWNDLGYLWDKRLTEFTVTFDTGTATQTLIMDTINGINGNTVNLDVGSFVINNSIVNSGAGRGMRAFAVPDSTIAKLVRLRALSTNSGSINSTFFRLLNVDFQYTKFPPDISLFTEPNDFGYPCEKVARNLTIKMDTGGVAATVYLLADGVAVASYSLTTTLDDWRRVVPVPNVPTAGDAIGRLFKLQFTPGNNGKAQLFDWTLDFVKEPCQVSQIDTYETDFGFNGWKYLYQGWFDYFAANPLTLNILRDGGSVFYSTTLPAHSAYRDMEKIFFPMLSGSQFNKSKVYRIRINGSGNTFKLYANTKLDWMPWNGDQRASFQQFPLSPENPLPTG